ncbi:MAG: hypothetical protein WBY94_26420 [Polyangiaceae bacterium]
MRELPLLPFVLWMTGCLQIGTDSTNGSGGSTAPAAPAPGTSTAAAAPSGTNCAQDPTTQAILCEQIDTCPGVDVEPGAFPNCGFRVYGAAALDLECVCDTSLCPVGVPTTCAQAQALLDGQTSLIVCQQQAEGRCVDFASPDAGASTCDTVCRDECAGAPTCLQLCGC